MDREFRATILKKHSGASNFEIVFLRHCIRLCGHTFKLLQVCDLSSLSNFCGPAMAPMKAMKAMKAKATMKAMKGAKLMSKGALATELSEASGLKKGEISTILDTLAEIGTKEVKKNGKFTLPGLCMIKTRKKKATKGGKKMMFGKEVKVKPQPAKTVVKAFPVAALKQQI